MRALQLQDHLSRGLGAAARHIGQLCAAYRPDSPADPLAERNHYRDLHASFTDDDQHFRRPIGYGRAVWSGIFDTGCTRPGDYIQGEAGVFFIAAQQALLPSLCVQTNRTLTIQRPGAPTLAGVNGYGGLLTATATPLLTNWPASVLFAGAGSPGDLPGDASIPAWTVLLPTGPATPQSADLIVDDQGKSYVISSAEQSALGWRILAKQATN